MGTEVAVSFSTLRAQLENEKSSLFKIDENIKKIVQTSNRFSNDRFNASAEYSRGGLRAGGRNSYPDSKNDDLFGKRKHETKTVFSRLSARTQDSDNEDVDGAEAGATQKRMRVPSAVSRSLPTRAAVLRAQAGDATARSRNKRIFGALLGTLHKFKQEEIVLQTKEDKKAQVERKIEEQARLEKEREQRERKTLFAEREHKKATIKALEAKMARVQEFERWEGSQKSLANFILTRAKPHIYWLPKKMTEKAQEKLNSSRKFHEKCMTRKRQELKEELQRIEQRCLRLRGPAAKENDPHDHEAEKTNSNGKPMENSETPSKPGDEKGRKRDKFAVDVDDKEDSDADDMHDEVKTNDVELKDHKEADETKMDTSLEQNSTIEAEKTQDTVNNTSIESIDPQETEPKETESVQTETIQTEAVPTDIVQTESGPTETIENQEDPVEPQINNDMENAENVEHS